MAYTTPAAVREALSPEGSDQTGATAAALSDGALNSQIADVTAEIDATVSGAPFADNAVPRIISVVARDIAAYLATLTARKNVQLPADHPVRLRYERARGILAIAAKGQLDLTDDPETSGSEPQVVNPYEGDLFDLEALGLGLSDRVLPPWNDPVP